MTKTSKTSRPAVGTEFNLTDKSWTVTSVRANSAGVVRVHACPSYAYSDKGGNVALASIPLDEWNAKYAR